FSYAASDRSGKILRPSPLLKLESGEGGPAERDRVEGVDSAPSSGAARHLLPASGEKGRNFARQLQLLAGSGTRSTFDGFLFASVDDPVLRAGILQKLQSVSPTRLEDFGECPQKFLLKHILGVEDFDDPDRELQMNRRDKGSLDHQILERFYRGLDEKSLGRAEASFPRLDPDLRARADAIVDDVFAENETRMPPFNRLMHEIEKKTTKRNLHAFLAADIEDLITNGLRPRHFEYTFGRA